MENPKDLKAEYEAVKKMAREVNRAGWIANGQGNESLAQELESEHKRLVQKQAEAFKAWMENND